MWMRRMRRVLWWLWLTCVVLWPTVWAVGGDGTTLAEEGTVCLLCGGRCIFAIGGRGQRGEPALSSVKGTIWGKGAGAVAYPYRIQFMGMPVPLLEQSSTSQGIHVNNPESSKEVLFLNAVKGYAWQKRSTCPLPDLATRWQQWGKNLHLFGNVWALCDIERYSPEQDLWTRLKPLLNDRFCYGLTATGGRRVLMFGGKKMAGRTGGVYNKCAGVRHGIWCLERSV